MRLIAIVALVLFVLMSLGVIGYILVRWWFYAARRSWDLP